MLSNNQHQLGEEQQIETIQLLYIAMDDGKKIEKIEGKAKPRAVHISWTLILMWQHHNVKSNKILLFNGSMI